MLLISPVERVPLNLGPLIASQMLLPLSYWSSGIGADDNMYYINIDFVHVLSGGM